MSQWQMLHHIIGAYERGGETAAAVVLAMIDILSPGTSAPFRDIINRLYIASEQKWPAVALHYNRVGASWGEIERMAAILVAEHRTSS